MRIDKNTTIRLGDKNIVKIKIGDSVIWEKKTGPEIDYFYIESLGDGNTVSVINRGDGSTDNVTPTLEYSTDKNTWNTITFDWTSGTHTTNLPITLNTGEKMYFRNDTRLFSNSSSKYITFSSSVSSNVGGDIRTLSNYLDVNNETTPQKYMFYYLFYNNKNIVDASNLRLSYNTLADFCYSYLFYNCSSLINAPSLPSTTLASYCYSGLFYGCSSLQNAPSLPATTLASYCYTHMYRNCVSLQMAPELPATTLEIGCYISLFSGCTSLTTAPELPATTLADKSYINLFYNCSSLNEVTVYANDISATNCTSNWLLGVASSGTFNNMGSATYTKDSTSGIPTGWTEVKPDYLYVENTYNGGNTISVKQTITGSPDSSLYAKTLQYSKDKTNWSTITLSSTTYNINLNQGERVYFRGNEGVFNYWYSGGKKKAITNILGTQSHTIGGNINTLINYYNPNNLTLSQGVFNSLFENDTNLTSSSDIILPPPSNGVLPSYAYLYLFKNCTNMVTTLSELPYVKQGEDSCNGMFARTAITTAPALPSMELAKNCYFSLFEGCTSLVNPPALPATVLAQNCYRSLFYGCTSLVNPPELPATKMEMGCYQQLFRNCSKLVNAPALPATVLAQNCYRNLFHGCTSLVNPPELPATTLAEGCYQSLFYGCSKLNNVTVYARDISATNCTTDWLSGVASKGTFNNYGSATYVTDSVNGIPTGWTVVKPNEPDYFYVENTHNGNNNIYVKTRAGYSGTEPTGEFATTLEYSKDKTNWTTINLNYDYHMNGSNLVTSLVTNLTLSLSVGEKVYFRNTSGYFGYVGDKGTHSHQFSSDENIKVGGNIKSLLDYRDMVGTTMKKGCFYEMFFESYTLRDASELILPDTVADSCYLKLFSSCVYLTSIPSLPALTMAPRCYCEMFKNTAITTPPALPSTNLAEYCYKNMLEGTPITTPPTLPATTLSVGCYQGLFNSCNKLTTAPVLQATTLVDYCYRYLFMGCTKLNSITTYANNINAEECTRWWLESVASSGTLHNMGSATYVTDSGDGIPTGWTEVKS